MDDVRLASNADRDRVLRNRPVLEEKLTDHLDLRIGKPRLHLARIENHEPIVRSYARIGQIRQSRKAERYGIEPIPIVTDGHTVCPKAQSFHVERGDVLRMCRVREINGVVRLVRRISDVVGQAVRRKCAFVANRRDRRCTGLLGFASKKRYSRLEG